jgi:hypothetical protein
MSMEESELLDILEDEMIVRQGYASAYVVLHLKLLSSPPVIRTLHHLTFL